MARDTSRDRLARVGRTLGAYVALTKPRIIELLLVTTVPTMVLAARGLPSLTLVLATLVGGTAAAGSANTLNCVLDRDIDSVMNRTRRRPLVTGEISPRAGVIFGLVLGAAAVAWFALLVNVVSAVLALAAILLYVVGYTMLLKRRTPQNIVWGGVAGCMPVLIGWSAVTGSVAWAPVALFAVVFFWTPPHYWPLSMKFRRDYATAGVPMLPVVAGDVRVAVEMMGYTVAMVAASLALVPLAGMSWVYALAAGALGAWFGGHVVALWVRARRPGRAKLGEMRVFHHSITYLTLLFVAVAVDPFLPV
ncbi:heme o synthase [Isoptericola sp. b441]|uniref:Protoheme IX farnesyltransferase n=1 Tax=Actinotalea lenta TaxID=3064654 RepID=A0ABT9DEQ9_9CELL|nr:MULTISPECIES: heme o synthase [unclassified Isoptericola]MDO8107682.1 heme o synthase [Isoptericola sp. b441]MDO8120658.1 heme o synthase [Isoptericola sp. b490]